MKNNIFLTLFSFLIVLPIVAQQNMNLLSNFTYQQSINDIWGYEKNGNEYALVGVRNGVSIVNVTSPTNPVESDFIPGPSSTWRDLKTYNDFAYVTNETGDGLLVIDLSTLPGTVNSQYYKPVVNGAEMEEGHNLYIDEFGFIYVVGGDKNNGGAVILDANQNPWNPPVVGLGPSIYAHDIYVRDNIMYNSEIYAGVFTAYDIADKSNPVYLGSQSTSFVFTHNAWLSDNSTVIFAADERSDAPIGAYDITDLSSIQQLDDFRPPASVGQGVIPHNVHVHNDFLVISYYTDGVVVVDANRPQNLVQVGQYKTWQGPSGGFNGCWGAYPFLPSGNVLATDISGGLFVLGTNYVRACYLEGQITGPNNNNPVSPAQITILSPNISTSTDGNGDYAMGTPDAGTYSVLVSSPGYKSKTVTATLINGQVTILDVQLELSTPFQFVGKVVDFDTGDPIANAKLNFSNPNYDHSAVTNALGEFSINYFFEDSYEVYAGVWGHIIKEQLNETIDTSTNYVIELKKGYEDVFQLDLGWTVSGNALSGVWERGEPIGTYNQGDESNPDDDVTSDVGDQCFVTGNSGGGPGDDEVFGGVTILQSPVFDVTTMQDPAISFYKWFFAAGGTGTPNDYLIFKLSNGNTTVVVDSADYNVQGWSYFEAPISQFLTPTANMTLIVECADPQPSVHFTEGAIDFFRAFDLAAVPNIDVGEDQFNLAVRPNPSSDQFIVDVQLNPTLTKATLVVTSLLGQVLETIEVTNQETQVEFGEQLNAGVYLVQLISSNSKSQPIKVIKVN